MFRRVLIANRAEIALRVMRTCARLGVETVAVHSAADADALHARSADRALALAGERPGEGYLDVEQLVAAARSSGADALHPGYGFLSESPTLARACEAAGIVFVGPHVEALRRMGSKIEARRIAAAHGVPVVPGYDGDAQDDATLSAAAREIGFPVMIKASAGGGGRGIRIVEDPAALERACAQARSEAERAFGDGSLIVERYVRRPRHVEVQLAGDRHGQLLHLFERDCSVQRRHQKLVEEAPAPGLDPGLRERLLAAALKLGRAIGYDSVGTVEFVLDAAAGEAFFCEMNTRLQVEHPTTEHVTGLDLVELQLRAAAGEPLGLTQDDVRLQGWAIEVRLNAEDPSRGFAPRTGRIARVDWPTEPNRTGTSAPVRVDTGFESGSEISAHYDSLVAKLITSGATREQALGRMREALDDTLLIGPGTNAGLLRALVAHPAFVAGELTTGFLEQHLADGFEAADSGELPDHAVAALACLAPEPGGADPGPWGGLGAWRLLEPAGAPARQPVYLERGRERFELHRVGETAIDAGDGPVAASARWLDARWLQVEHAGGRERIRAGRSGDQVSLIRDGRRSTWRRVPAERAWREREAGAGALAGAIAAPFPGQIVELRTKPGERVAAGDVLVVLEAMKMHHDLAATGAGVVAGVHCTPGQAVAAGEVLVTFEAAEPEASQ